MTFLGWLSDLFKGISDLQKGDEKVTLNHLDDLFKLLRPGGPFRKTLKQTVRSMGLLQQTLDENFSMRKESPFVKDSAWIHKNCPGSLRHNKMEASYR